jgi:hypothetical protein
MKPFFYSLRGSFIEVEKKNKVNKETKHLKAIHTKSKQSQEEKKA